MSQGIDIGPDWLPIDTYNISGWEHPEVEVRYEGGEPFIASYGFEDESYDDVIFAWHNLEGSCIPEPDYWRAV